jgi:hypothetical protein
MQKNEIAIATITRVRDAEEDLLLREAMQTLTKQDIPVVVVDRGSSREFVSFLKSLPNSIVLTSSATGLMAQVQLSIATASDLGRKYILYTESDKKLFFKTQLQRFIAEASADESIGLFVAARTLESFRTFPGYQVYTETVANKLYAELFGQQGDFCYGPLLISRALVPSLKSIAVDIGWGWRFYVLGVAHQSGYQVALSALDLPCPPEQRETGSEPERAYRIRQLLENLQGLLLASAAVCRPAIAAPGRPSF